MELLTISNLSIQYETYDGLIKAVKELSISIERGKILGLVGESGSGKSQTGFAILRLLSENAQVSGSILFDGQELLKLSEKRMRALRSTEIAMVFQDPMTSLNPYLTIQTQLIEVLRHHQGKSNAEALADSLRMLDAVKISQAKQRIKQYPHEFSGGMRQRVVIAMALLCHPKLLIADEPTTALDVTVQAEIVQLLKDLQHEFAMTMLFISHDLGVVASLCDKIAVMQKGVKVEFGDRDEVFLHPQTDYTRSLLNAIPRLPEGTFGDLELPCR